MLMPNGNLNFSTTTYTVIVTTYKSTTWTNW